MSPEYADYGHFKKRSDTAIIEEHRRMKAEHSNVQFRPFGNNNIDDSAATPNDVDATSDNDNKENNLPLVPTVLLDMSNARSSSFFGKKGSEEKRR